MTPQTFAYVLQLVAFTASAVIFWRSELVINLMGHTCRFVVRVAFWLLVVGSMALILALSQGYEPTLPVTLALCGTAILLASERRLKGVLRLHSPVATERRAP